VRTALNMSSFANPMHNGKEKNSKTTTYKGNPELLASHWYGGANHRYRLKLREQGVRRFRDQIQKKLWLTALAACLMMTVSLDNTLHPPHNFDLDRQFSQAEMLVSNTSHFYGDSSISYQNEQFLKGLDEAWNSIAIDKNHRIFTLYYIFAQGMTCVFNIMSLCSLLWIMDSFAFHVMDDEVDSFLKSKFASFMLDLPTMLNWWAFFSMMFSWGIGIAIVTKDPNTNQVGKLAETLIGLGSFAFVVMFTCVYIFRRYNQNEAMKYYVNIDGSPAFPELATKKSSLTINAHGKDSEDEYL